MVKAEMNYQQIRKAIEKLPLRQKVKLSRELHRQTWANKLKDMFTEINSRPKPKISLKEIQNIVDEAREEVYARRRCWHEYHRQRDDGR